MADVGRGQLLLVAALGLAALFVALALILNTAIFTENLATRGSDVRGGVDVASYRNAALEGGSGAMEHANEEHNGSYDHLEENFTAGVRDFSNLSGRHAALDGRSANVSVADIRRGTRIVQTNESRNFTDDDANADWKLAGDVSDTRGFWMNVSRDSLTDSSQSLLPVDAVYYARFTDAGGSEWRVYVYRNLSANSLNVTVKDMSGLGTAYGPCTTPRDHAIVNLTNESIAGDPCPELGYPLGNMTGEYAITYNDTTDAVAGDTAAGEYELTVDSGDVHDAPYHPLGSGKSPHKAKVLYSATLRVSYRTSELRYVSNATVAPGDPDV